MRGDMLNERLLDRIRNGLEMTVAYPEERPAVTGSSPTSTPVNILTGTRQTPAVYPVSGTPIRPAVTLKCLFYPAYGSVPGQAGRNKHYIDTVGWQADADALAQVEIAEAALDEDDYRGDTVFTGCDHVEVSGHHYRVLSVVPIGPGHRDPVSYYVWLKGNAKQ